MDAKATGGAAFPIGGGVGNKEDWKHGMTLRDYFAATALQGMLAHDHPYQQSDEYMFARDAYVLADAMLNERMK